MEDKKCPRCGAYDEFLTIDFFEIEEGVWADIKACIYCDYSTVEYYEKDVDNLKNK